MKKNERKFYGLLAKFDTPEALLFATNRIYEAGYRKFDTYSPYPVEGLAHAMRLRSSPLPYVVLVGGILGALIGFGMQWYATVFGNPWNIGGRPLNSWPAYVPIAFETTILFAAFAGVIGLFIFTRLPQPYHPVFNSEDFTDHGSQDSFYLGIEASDQKFDVDNTRKYLKELGSIQVTEINA